MSWIISPFLIASIRIVASYLTISIIFKGIQSLNELEPTIRKIIYIISNVMIESNMKGMDPIQLGTIETDEEKDLREEEEEEDLEDNESDAIEDL